MKTKIMMASRKLKIPRKTNFWSVTPTPATHKKQDSIPMLIVLRDYLKLGDKEREITRILNNNLVRVDGKIVKDRRFPVGFMDVLTIEGMDDDYIIMYDLKGKLVARRNPQENKGVKLFKVVRKTVAGNNKIQLGMHDGKTITTERKDIHTSDVLLMKVPDLEIVDVLKLADGDKVFITGGSHVGELASIKSIEVKQSSVKNMVHLNEGFSTIKDYIFVVGTPKYTFKTPELGVTRNDE
ncbi:30S ribosomal protein S4e [Ferroplasma sp.]|uniref:30S ribosomal protein S4e n=1 Tax=Ferroplasma sp. TaxID=2591003 RepID=UPI00262EB1D3|nr:30S ribosomal protein S4e [Ferroplasma sp.]MCL4452867.1 30S ribosomal protein S4e [Candidatus Thermoplasmatota archaeon]